MAPAGSGQGLKPSLFEVPKITNEMLICDQYLQKIIQNCSILNPVMALAGYLINRCNNMNKINAGAIATGFVKTHAMAMLFGVLS
jgi:hypothetical protein